jgi:pyochelin synthetase
MLSTHSQVNVTDLMRELATLGIQLALEDGQIRITAAKGVLTGELRGRLVAHRDNIVRLMEESADRGKPELARRIVSRPDRDHEPFPLSDLQLGFYIANDPYMEFYVRPHCYMENDVVGLDVEVYQRAWNRTLERHRREICIVDANAELTLLREPSPIEIRVYDLRAHSKADVEKALTGIREEMERRELPLDVWPWFDLRASRRMESGREVVRIHYNHNNFFIDGFGTTLLMEEIDRCYRNMPPSAPPCEISYRDAVLGLNELAESAAGVKAREYWLSRISDLPSPPALPQRTGFIRRTRSKLSRRSGAMSPQNWESFKKTATARGITPSNALICAYSYLLATWSNSDHFIVSQMATRRMRELHPDTMRMLGNFVSLYPLEIRLQPERSFADNARTIQERVLQDTRHLQFGGMRVMQELNRLKGSFGSAPSPFVVGSGLALKHWRNADYTVLETSQTVLDHQFFELADGSLSFVWDLIEEYFPQGLVDCMWPAYSGLIGCLARDASAWDSQRFALLTDQDLQARRRCNQTGTPLSDRLLQDGLANQAAERPEASVLLGSDGSLTFRELAAWSSIVSSELLSHGVRAGDRVVIILERGAELLAAVLGVLQVRAAYVPVDPGLPEERVALLLRDVGARVVLTAQKHAGLMQWPGEVALLIVTRPRDLTSPRPESVPASRSSPLDLPSPADLAYVIYTSGSTGKPKGVMIDHRGAVNTIEDINRRFDVGPADRIFGVSAFTFDLSVYDIFAPLAAGASVVYPEPHSRLDPSHWVDLLLEHAITIWNSVPALFALLVESAERRGVRFPALRLAMLSGDKIPLDLPAAIRRIAPNSVVVSLGGATEASIWSIYYPIASVNPEWATIPYGVPLTNQTWHVLDRTGEHCPSWVAGDLYIGGVGLALGYWDDQVKTDGAFQFNSLTGERLYRTGDVGRYFPDGCIEWLGRSDHQLKIQGHRIDPAEIEATLSRCAGVRECAVVALGAMEGRPKRLVGHLAMDPGAAFDSTEVEAFLGLHLPAYMVPTQWRTWPQLPLTKNSKVDRQVLAQSAPIDSTASPRQFETPATDLEAAVLSIWQRVLKTNKIGVTDDFFDLGGQSFDAIRVFARVKEEFARSFTLSDMWTMRTIRALAQSISRGTSGPNRRQIVEINAGRLGEPLFLVHPAGGSVLGYAPIGRLLGRPLRGIQAVEEQSEAQQSISALAERYVAALRQSRAKGPYALGGWSTGAIIAFEMAVQLEQAGESVGELLLLDGPIPQRHAELDERLLLTWFIDDLGLGVPVAPLQRENFGGLSIEDQLVKGGDVTGLSKRPEFDLATLLPSFRTFRSLVAASTEYRPGTLSCDLTIVKCSEQIVREFSEHPHRNSSDWGWGEYTRGRVKCIVAPGNHYTFLAPPQAGQWIAALEDTAATRSSQKNIV